MAGRLIFVVAAVLTATAAQAQLADPMRPPAGLSEKPGGSGAATDEGGSPLQAVILRRGDKPVALLGGERVTLGSRVGDARVVAISDSEVVLAGRSGRQVIKISPDVQKKLHSDAAVTNEEKKSAARRKPATEQGEAPK